MMLQWKLHVGRSILFWCLVWMEEFLSFEWEVFWVCSLCVCEWLLKAQEFLLKLCKSLAVCRADYSVALLGQSSLLLAKMPIGGLPYPTSRLSNLAWVAANKAAKQHFILFSHWFSLKCRLDRRERFVGFLFLLHFFSFPHPFLPSPDAWNVWLPTPSWEWRSK